MRSKDLFPTSLFSAAAALFATSALAQEVPAGEAAASAPEAAPVAPEVAPEPKADPKAEAYYSAGPGSATLPAGVMRLKTGPIEGFGDKGRDNEGKSVDYGISADGWGLGFAFAYGITDTISVEMSSGYALTNKVGIDHNKFRGTALYKNNYDAFVNTAAGVLATTAGSPCGTPSECVAYIEGGGTLSASSLQLPTGETLHVKKNTPIKAYADSLVLNGAKAEEGDTGFQDIDVGVMWNALKGDWYGGAAALGMRIPVGSFSDVPSSRRATGRGTWDMGLKLIGDVKIMDGVWFSAENQMEWNLAETERKKTSLLDNTQTIATKEKFKRWGTRHKGLTKIVWGLGNVSQKLNWLGVELAPLKWEFNSIDVVDGRRLGAPAQFTETEFGVKLDGFPMGIPLQLYSYYVVPTWGRNLVAACSWTGATLSAFYKF